MQACTPVYQLASRSVRIRNRPLRQDSTELQEPCRTVRRSTSTPVHCYIRRDGLPKPQNHIAIWSWPECSRWGAGACVRARKQYFSRSSLTFANTCCV